MANTQTSIQIAALGRTLLQFESTIRDLGDNCFRAHAAWREFPSKVISLRAAHDDLEKKLQIYGIREDNFASFLELVQEAKRLLDDEVATLRDRADRRASTCTCYSICGMLFPVSIDAHILVAERAYKRISEHLTNQTENDERMRKITQSQSFVPPIRNDGRYVPLRISEEKIVFALEAAGPDPAVVLLCGGPGKGKSILSRQVILRYIDINPKFSPVILLGCGPEVNIAAKQAELLQQLGEDLPQQSQVMELSKALGGAMSKQSQAEDIKVLKLLQRRLSNPKMLIVLDDLREPELLHSLFNLSGSGSGAKYLITSQQEDICERFHYTERTVVQIEDINEDDARKILASHADLEGQDIPQHLQELGNKIIIKAKANPSVLAKLGATIRHAGGHKVEVWEDVLEHMFKLLKDGALEKFISPQ